MAKHSVLDDISDRIDDIEKRLHLETMQLEDTPAMSTGNLALDLMLGGGIRPAMYTSAGFEQTSKTTDVIIIMAAAVKEGIPIVSFWDYEGSTASSKKYVENIFRTSGLTISEKELFGQRDEKGAWKVRPKVRYRSESELEAFFNYAHAVLEELPDKRCIHGKWWLRYDESKQNKTRYGSISDKSMEKKFGAGYWIPAEDGGKLQAIFFVDSYPAMLSAAADKEDADNSLASQARAFSKHIPRVKGRMAKKMVALVGVNQLRQVPMAMFGPKENEPGGIALKQFSDVRIKHTSRALSVAPILPIQTSKKDFLEVEKSVEFADSSDRYRYIAITSIKNKITGPTRKFLQRIWVQDGSGEARGIDPVFDTVQYLKATGQISGNRKKFKLSLDSLGKTVETDWVTIKNWVLGDKEKMTKISQKLGYKPMSLRAFCFRQIKDKTSERLYNEFAKTSEGKESSEGD